MNYRKLRKAYYRRFGCYVFVSLSKEGKKMKKISKWFTANEMKKALYTNRPIGGVTGTKDGHLKRNKS